MRANAVLANARVELVADYAGSRLTFYHNDADAEDVRRVLDVHDLYACVTKDVVDDDLVVLGLKTTFAAKRIDVRLHLTELVGSCDVVLRVATRRGSCGLCLDASIVLVGLLARLARDCVLLDVLRAFLRTWCGVLRRRLVGRRGRPFCRRGRRGTVCRQAFFLRDSGLLRRTFGHSLCGEPCHWHGCRDGVGHHGIGRDISRNWIGHGVGHSIDCDDVVRRHINRRSVACGRIARGATRHSGS